VALFIDENVFRFEISVNDIKRVNVLDGKDYFRNKELSLIFFEDLLLVKVVSKITA